MADEEKCRKLESLIEVNAKKMEIKMKELQDCIDAERRKSNVVEQRAEELERKLNEKMYVFNELTRKKSEDERGL